MSCNQLAPRGDADVTISSHLPSGVAWIAFRMPGKLAYKLWTAFSRSYDAMSTALCRAHTEIDPRTTTELVTEWETALSLPDPCLPSSETIEQRRQNILFRLRFKRWTTAQDWIEIATLYGLNIVITPGWLVQKPALYAHTYPKRYDFFPKLGRFRVYINVIGFVRGGYDYGQTGRGDGYPVPYGDTSDDLSQFQCIIDRIRPANSIVIWNAPLEDLPYGFCISESFSSDYSTEFC